MLTYPDVFSSEGTLDENGRMNFYTLWDTGMLFWIESNESGWITDAFMETFDARASMELQGNVVIACGEGTDAYGNVVPMAWYCVVDPGFIANVEVQCTDSDEADDWYGGIPEWRILDRKRLGNPWGRLRSGSSGGFMDEKNSRKGELYEMK